VKKTQKHLLRKIAKTDDVKQHEESESKTDTCQPRQPQHYENINSQGSPGFVYANHRALALAKVHTVSHEAMA
jgi:hypothetical protein